MNVFYVYCHSCGYEAFDQYVAFSRTTASSDWWICPHCGEETDDVDEEE